MLKVSEVSSGPHFPPPTQQIPTTMTSRPCADRHESILTGIFDFSQHNRRYLRHIYEYLPGTPFKEWTISHAIECGHRPIVDHLLYNRLYHTCFRHAIETIIKYGWYETLEHVLSTRQIEYSDSMKYAAVEHGQRDILALLADKYGAEINTYCVMRSTNKRHIHMLQFYTARGILGDSTCANEAAKKGDMLMLHHFMKHGILPTQAGADLAATNGHTDVVVFLDSLGIECSMTGFTAALRKGFTNMLEFFVEVKNIHISEYQCGEAVRLGLLDTVKYLYSKGIKCPESAMLSAIRNEHLDVVQFLVEQGYEITLPCLQEAMRYDSLKLVKFLCRHSRIRPSTNDLDIAAGNGFIHIIQYFHALGYKCSSKGAGMAAERTNQGVLFFLYSNGIYCTAQGVHNIIATHDRNSAVIGTFEGLLARNPNQSFTPELANFVCSPSRFEVLIWLVNHNVLPDSRGIDDAIQWGYIDIVRFLYQHGARCSDAMLNRIQQPGRGNSATELLVRGVHGV